jgi:hypothetical protein
MLVLITMINDLKFWGSTILRVILIWYDMHTIDFGWILVLARLIGHYNTYTSSVGVYIRTYNFLLV